MVDWHIINFIIVYMATQIIVIIIVIIIISSNSNSNSIEVNINISQTFFMKIIYINLF